MTQDNQEALTCPVGPHTFYRTRKRGKKPKYCPAHQPQPSPRQTPTVSTQSTSEGRKRELSAEHKAALLEGRKRKAEARAQEEAEARALALKEEARSIDDRVLSAETSYKEALAKTRRAVTPGDIDRAFNIADTRQVQLINLLVRKRVILDALGT